MKKNIIKIIYAIYDDDDVLLNNIKFLLKKNIEIYEVYTPFPVHGLAEILKLKEPNISKLAFIYGLIGVIISVILTWYTMNYDWPQNIGGKPEFKWYMNMPSFLPVIFEFMIFCSAHFMCINYFISCKLFPGAKKQNPDPRTTDDKFLIEIHTEKSTNDLLFFLKKNGAKEIKIKEITL